MEEENAVFSAEKLIPNLECMKTDFGKLKKWFSSNSVNYWMHSLKELSLSSVTNGELLCRFLYRMPNLEKLQLSDSEHLLKESLVPCLGTVVQLKELVLLLSRIKDLGFEQDPVLQRLEILSLKCGLRNLMASSTAKSLVQLKTMKIIHCANVKEIVIGEGNEEGQVTEIVFRKLITIELAELNNLKSFCTCQNCNFKFPSLEVLIVRECPMETFSQGHTRAPKLQNVLAVEAEEEAKWQLEGDLNATIQKVFNDKVTFMYTKDLDISIYPEFIEQLWHDNHLMEQNCFRNLKRFYAYGCRGLVHVIPSHLLPFENLEELEVDDSSVAKDLTRLEVLWVMGCSELEELFSKDEKSAEGATEMFVFNSLTSLRLYKMPGLKYLYSELHTVEWPVLEELHCSLVKFISQEDYGWEEEDLVQVGKDVQVSSLNELPFEKLKFARCSFQEIFAAERPNALYTRILLHLKGLELLDLDNLKSIGLENSWLQSIAENLQTLQKLFYVPWLFRFNIINHSIKWFSAKDATPQQECDLNSVALRIFEEKILDSARSGSGFNRKDSPLQEIWLSSLSILDLCLSNLACLIVKGYQFLPDVVLPFNLLPSLTQLETLEVRDCDSVKAIFDVKCITQDSIMRTMEPAQFPLSFSLKKLTLSKLPNVENIWNEDPQRILRMQLQQLSVDNCKCLTSVFPATVAKDLMKLEDLVVKHCEELMTIVAEDNADPRESNLELTFPSMKSLTLWDLPMFKCFYYCSLQRQMLKASTSLEPLTEDQICIAKLTPNLQHLTLGENEVKVIWRGDFEGNLLDKTPSHVKELRLYSLPELVSIGSENTWIEPFLRNLETLEVMSCFSSINLVSSTVSFSSLTCLNIYNCNSLLYLFTSSTAKSLAQLKTMEIKYCNSIEEVVSKDEDESQEDEIRFPQLNCLKLIYLGKLKCFFKGSLSFPSLEELSVINCKRMETLCPGKIDASKLVELNLDKVRMPSH
ncbi:hypothetical protein VNO78_25189 [Psophocarpus tetragonolobus]|uniref:Disease resistance protein At4g27190-like leucine-rich repeats domain-containing protein n=1 Tax=Psophocarpus tetragonolobus TaxID=3891 RepID=A0AAN9XEU3_PSOTE